MVRNKAYYVARKKRLERMKLYLKTSFFDALIAECNEKIAQFDKMKRDD